MKRVNYLIESIADVDNLRYAAWKAAKGKRHAPTIMSYFGKLDENILLLREQIISGLVDVGNYRFFKIYDPKERQICASAFAEQVLHHGIMNVCHDFFEQKQIYHSYACRKGKGNHAAVRQAQRFSKKYPWYLKLDVRKFFASIHHHVMLNQVERLFKDRVLLDIFEQIIRLYYDKVSKGQKSGAEVLG